MEKIMPIPVLTWQPHRLLRMHIAAADVSPVAVDPVGYPARHNGTPPDAAAAAAAEFWWQRYNPNVHPELKVMAVDERPLDPH